MTTRIMDSLQSNLRLRLNLLHNNILRFPKKLHFSHERAVLMAGVVIFSLMGSFVFWGPSKKKKRKSRSSTGVNGLVNMGETCFLNTLLQALAANPIFCEWLTRHQQSKLAQALLEVIKHVNGNNSSESDMPLYPRMVVSALAAQGWTLGIGQQDSHELFFALMSSLEEQTTQLSKPHDILQQLGQEDKKEAVDKNNSSSASVLENAEEISPQVPIDDVKVSASIVNEDAASSMNVTSDCNSDQRTSFLCRVGNGHSQTFLSHHRTDFPFRGQQLSQLTCTVCFRASVVQHQAFDCLSLPLPACGLSTLEMLLSNFTAPEQVHEVQCDHCTSAAGQPVRNTFVKQLTIGRLPKCLCIHIQRTVWLNDGQAYKRHDYVDFPEILMMDKFTYCYKERVRRSLLQQLHLVTASVDKHTLVSPVSSPEQSPVTEENSNKHDCDSKINTSELSNGSVKHSPDSVDSNTNNNNKKKSFGNNHQLKDKLKPRNCYKLQAVVVHLGEVTSGHFVTFRRPPNSIYLDKWVCTSDEEISSSNLAEVMRARAYMLFYEKT